MKIRVVFRSVFYGLLIALLAPAAGLRARRRHSVAKVRVLVSLIFWTFRPQNGSYGWVRIGSATL